MIGLTISYGAVIIVAVGIIDYVVRANDPNNK
jgi:hypothetical protein